MQADERLENKWLCLSRLRAIENRKLTAGQMGEILDITEMSLKESQIDTGRQVQMEGIFPYIYQELGESLYACVKLGS